MKNDTIPYLDHILNSGTSIDIYIAHIKMCWPVELGVEGRTIENYSTSFKYTTVLFVLLQYLKNAFMNILHQSSHHNL